MTNAEVVILFVLLDQGPAPAEELVRRGARKNITDRDTLREAITSLLAQGHLRLEEKSRKFYRTHPA